MANRFPSTFPLAAMVAGLALSGCGASALTHQPGATEEGPESAQPLTGGIKLFTHSFEDGQGPWGRSLDGSVGCSECPAGLDDSGVFLSAGWPGHGSVLTVDSNVRTRPCVTLNTIAHRPVPYRYADGRPFAGQFWFDLDLRQWRTDPPYVSHQMDMNFTIGRKSPTQPYPGKERWLDRYVEVGIITNPYHAFNGWLYTKLDVRPLPSFCKKADPVWGLCGLADLKTKSSTWATDWHQMRVIVHVTEAENYFMLESVLLDGTWYPIRKPMPTFEHIVDPGHWGANETMMLETGNTYTACRQSTTHRGVSVFDNVRATFYPW